MRVLVTGGAGYIGSHVVKALLKDHEVTVLDTLEYGHRDAIDPRAAFFKADVGDRRALRTIFRRKHDAVIHFAGYINVGESVNDPYKYYMNNVWKSMQLLAAMRENKVRRIVFSSTAAVYGIPEKVPIKEDSELLPINPYGSTKLAFERMLPEFRLDHVALRYFNAAGAAWGLGEDHRPETHLIPIVLRKAMASDTVQINGDDYDTPDGTCVRDYVHVKDLATAHILALKKGSGAYNVGYGKGFSIKQIIAEAERTMGKRISHSIGPRRAGDPDVLVADSSRLRRLGWRPKESIRTIIKSAFEWHKGSPGGYRS
jgi:UDP-glucose 4-epimerase